MFSIITIASSTTKPVEIVSAISVRLLRLYPSRYITPNVPTSDNGTATLGMIVEGILRRNRKITITTRAIQIISSHSTSRTEVRQERFDAIDDADDVRTRLALNVHDDRGGLIHPRGLTDILRAIDNVGDIIQLHRRAVAIGDDERTIVGAAEKLIVGADRVCL